MEREPAHRHDSQPDLGAAPPVRPVVRLAARRRPGSRGRGPARRARRDRLGRRLDRPPLRPGQRARQGARSRSPTGCCCSSPRVALLDRRQRAAHRGCAGPGPRGASSASRCSCWRWPARAASTCSGRARRARCRVMFAFPLFLAGRQHRRRPRRLLAARLVLRHRRPRARATTPPSTYVPMARAGAARGPLARRRDVPRGVESR